MPGMFTATSPLLVRTSTALRLMLLATLPSPPPTPVTQARSQQGRSILQAASWELDWLPWLCSRKQTWQAHLEMFTMSGSRFEDGRACLVIPIHTVKTLARLYHRQHW